MDGGTDHSPDGPSTSIVDRIRRVTIGPGITVVEVVEEGTRRFPYMTTPDVAVARVDVAHNRQGQTGTAKMVFRFERQNTDEGEIVVVDWWADRHAFRAAEKAQQSFQEGLHPRPVVFKPMTVLGAVYEVDLSLRDSVWGEPGVMQVEQLWRWRDQPIRDVQLVTRAMGLESEYAHVLTQENVPRSEKGDEVPKAVLRRLDPAPLSSSGFLGNGARAYPDVGHLEYATPECVSPMDLVAAVLAGDYIVDQAARRVERSGASELGVTGPFEVRFLRRCTDYRGNTHAAHENYQIAGGVSRDELDVHLPPFLASRPVIVGPGGFHEDTRDANGMVLDPRSLHIKGWASPSVHNKNLHMLKTASEAHDDTTGSWRLQIAGADANVMQVPLFLRFALTHLVLRQIESRSTGFRSLALLDSMKAIKQISIDPTLRTTVMLADGRRLTGLDLQEAYLEKTVRFVENEDVTDDDRLAVELWSSIVDDLRADPSKAADRVEWVAKQRAIQGIVERRGLGRTAERYLDLNWTDVRNDRGLRAPLEASGALRTLVDPARVLERVQKAPNTRAAVRAEIIQMCRRQRIDATVDWSWAQFDVSSAWAGTGIIVPTTKVKVSLGDPRYIEWSDKLNETIDLATNRRQRGRR